MKLKIDFAFKEIMMNEKARTGFLATVLHLNPEDIKETQILNIYLRKEHADDKQGILDVHISMNDDTKINTEIQLSELKDDADHDKLYLWAKFISSEKKKFSSSAGNTAASFVSSIYSRSKK